MGTTVETFDYLAGAALGKELGKADRPCTRASAAIRACRACSGSTLTYVICFPVASESFGSDIGHAQGLRSR